MSDRSHDLPDYLDQIGDTDLVINTIVGDTQRLVADVPRGESARQALSQSLTAVFRRLVVDGV